MELIEKQTNGQAGADGNPYLRTCRIEIRVSPLELDEIGQHSQAAGFRHVAPYLRTIGTQGIQAENPNTVRRALVAAQGQLSRIGNNLNQIARKLNAGHPLDDKIRLGLWQVVQLAESLLNEARQNRHRGAA